MQSDLSIINRGALK